MKSLLAIALTVVLLTSASVLYSAEGKSKTATIIANLHGTIPYACLNNPELYVRISDSRENPKTHEHDSLVGKVTIDNPTKDSYLIKIKVDPVAFKKKYGFEITSLREYIQILQHDASGKDQIVWQEYSHPYTSIKAKSYKWVHNIAGIC